MVKTYHKNNESNPNEFHEIWIFCGYVFNQNFDTELQRQLYWSQYYFFFLSYGHYWCHFSTSQSFQKVSIKFSNFDVPRDRHIQSFLLCCIPIRDAASLLENSINLSPLFQFRNLYSFLVLHGRSFVPLLLFQPFLHVNVSYRLQIMPVLF